MFEIIKITEDQYKLFRDLIKTNLYLLLIAIVTSMIVGLTPLTATLIAISTIIVMRLSDRFLYIAKALDTAITESKTE